MGDQSRDLICCAIFCVSRINPWHERGKCDTKESVINDISENIDSNSPGNFFINTGAVIAALLAFASLFIGIYGLIGLVTGQKMFAGSLVAVWGYLVLVGAYELNRRKFNWSRGSKLSDHHLMAGTVAVSAGLIVSGAMQETMPGLALLPAISAIMQANDGHEKKYLAVIHALLLLTGVAIAVWFYRNGAIGQVLLERADALP